MKNSIIHFGWKRLLMFCHMPCCQPFWMAAITKITKMTIMVLWFKIYLQHTLSTNKLGLIFARSDRWQPLPNVSKMTTMPPSTVSTSHFHILILNSQKNGQSFLNLKQSMVSVKCITLYFIWYFDYYQQIKEICRIGFNKRSPKLRRHLQNFKVGTRNCFQIFKISENEEPAVMADIFSELIKMT